MLKTMAVVIPARPTCTKINKNKFSSDGTNSDKIDDKMTNLLSSIKKMSSRASFFTLKASLAFTQLKKTFTKTLILYHFDLKYHI